MRKIRLALPTRGNSRMKDVVSDVFARAPTFTYIDIVEGEVNNIRVEVNKAVDLAQGTGPLVAKNLKDNGVNVVVASEVGRGAKTLLEMIGIRIIQVESGVRVSKAVKQVLKTHRNKLSVQDY